MPIYEYRRPDGSTFEVVQKFSDPTLTEEPETGVPVTRVFRPPAIHFKGSGFHNTDYGTRKRGKADSDGGSEGGGSSDGAKAETSSAGGDSSSSSSSSKASSDGASSSSSSDSSSDKSAA